ncbi:putative disease resistance RPP13-like protein 1 isoform X2 [Macadamia integrifolia]|uniref:putative disease resistance RPP13-like protein 1 isoform X2 n=1 Tax=Macadamia integrifolia TaxID=60698 RepID=UPI001C4F0AF5|nr:putative disease resistance RPP13-like protein 1 isoform X2 [Macadamia integrifolia]
MSSVGHSAFLQVAFDRLATPEFIDFVRQWKIDLDEVESLKETSAEIQALSDEAEVKQFTNVRVKLWLDRLKQVLYDAEDILDEYATEVLRLKLESAHQTQQVYNIIEELHGKVRDINERLKSVAHKGVDLGLSPSMGSGSSRARVFSQRPPTSSLVIRSKVFGIEEDMWSIVGWLLSDKTSSLNNNNNNFSVLAIVAMGGAGKTTLAQLVYNDDRVEQYFGLKAWVCVSEDFDVVRLTKEILESATGSSPDSDSLDVLQVKLKEALSKKRFLLVLDDMWNENYLKWDALSTPFAFGKPGSKILVTTRNKSVSSIVRTVPKDHDLKGLSDEACFALVRRHAFMDENSFDANTKLEVFGQQIVKKCKGSPLAVKTLAGLLRDKRENSEWKDILENEIWDLRESEILPSLMLSYYHLPPLLKRCFAYCALFPKDYIFNKIELVLLWMAEGIVQPKGRKRLEDIGAEYFDELFMRSFFELSDLLPHNQVSPFVLPRFGYTPREKLFYDLSKELHIRSFFESSNNIGSGFVMHDLIHDLAQVVSGGLYCRREYDKPSEILTTIRHLSYHIDNVVVTESEALKSSRTILDLKYYNYHNKQFLPTMQFHFQFQFLRVLCLRNCRNGELCDSIGKLKHLRFLDLSFSDIVRLPNSIRSLYNLQTLVLTGCWRLREFPEDMGNLINLRHLFLPVAWPRTDSWDSYEMPLGVCKDSYKVPLIVCKDSYKMPLGVGNLTSLQTLSTYVVRSKNSSELRDLSQQLRGTLNIFNLESVGNNETQAMVGNLKNMPHLLGLLLHWSHYESEDSFLDLGRDEKVEEDVLDQLQPPTNLETLWIVNYGGTRFPSWIEHPSFSNLETVHLIGCRKCRFLPHLSQLPLLKYLVIEGCNATKMVGSELHGDGSSLTNKQFRSLETLRIGMMEEWEEWPEVVEEGGGQFPCLRKLYIFDCPKLRMFSHHFPGLMELEIESCDELRELARLLPSLQQLHLGKCPKLIVLPSLPSIDTLHLDFCLQITTLSDSNHPSSSSSTQAAAPYVHNSFPCLRKLEILYCPNLRELPLILPSLESLLIRYCEEYFFFTTLPSIKELRLEKCKGMVLNSKTLPHHSSLTSLSINDVSNIKSLPKGFIQHLTALQNLEISHCTDLTVLLQNEIGIDLLPSSLKYLWISDCDNLGKLPGSMCNLHCLENIVIAGARGLASLPEGLHNLMCLQVLRIADCENLESLPMELHTLTSLRLFVIERCPAIVSLQETQLPTTLHALRITDCKNLESLPMVMSLQSLVITKCPALKSFPDLGLPTVLQDLLILRCGKLNSLPKGLHKLTNLKQLQIEECSFLMGCKNLEPLHTLGLHNLTSLQNLIIGGCPALVSIPSGLLPANLRDFRIKDCPILESLHDGLSDLTSLEHLNIRNCPMLTQRYGMKEGEEWSKISHIPEVLIDG